MILGALRIVPALLRQEGTTTEIAVAIAMLVLGIAILLRVPRLRCRAQGRWRHRA